MNSSDIDLLKELAEIVGEQWLKTSEDDLANYGSDWTTAYSPKPIAIVFPADTAAVVALVKLANSHQIALVPSGGRTGLSGGAVASRRKKPVLSS